jgi:hypothetical protein
VPRPHRHSPTPMQLPCALLPTETCFLPRPTSPYLPRPAPYRDLPTETCFLGWLPSPVIHDTYSSGVVRTKTPDSPLGLNSPLGVLSSCGSNLPILAVVTPHLGGRDASQGSQGSIQQLEAHWCVCLLLQDLVQSCLRGEGGDIGRHVLRETTSRGLCGLVCSSRTSERGGEGDCVKECNRRSGRTREVREGACIGAATMLPGAQWNLRTRGSQIKLSHVDAVAKNARQRPDRFHARRRAPPLHSRRQGFCNAGNFFSKISLTDFEEGRRPF